MKESFLHFIWQFQQFDHSNLFTVDGELVEVFETGNHNTDAGPDFLNAKIRIGEIVWHGQVEIHVSSSQWHVHGHHNDPAYDNVVLHVVWENDKQIKNEAGKPIPTIELKNRISCELLSKCNELLDSPDTIPCAGQLQRTTAIHIFSMQQKATIERLKEKSNVVFHMLKKNDMNWEETAFQLLAKNFGFKVNGEPFQRLAEKTPLKVLKKHSGNLLQIESMLFGVAGYLHESPKDEYHALLMNEYEFLARKYSLANGQLRQADWKLLRLRPGNFPTVRISQFAATINKEPHLFDSLTNFKSAKELVSRFSIDPSDYWKRNYSFGKKSVKLRNSVGVRSIENLMINTSVPLLAAYSQYVGEEKYMERAISILEAIKPEKNYITKKWKELGIEPQSAFESQALIEMYNNYCLKKKCLSCKIGVALIRNR